MLSILSKYVFHPLYDAKYKWTRLNELRSLNKTQWLSEPELEAIQLNKLKKIVLHAYINCPYYKNLLDKHNINPSINSFEEFQRIPILSKSDIRNNAEDLLSKQFTKGALKSSKTGGSTGTALKLYFDEKCEQLRNAAANRSNKWANWDMGDLYGALWGSPDKPETIKQHLRRTFFDRVLYLDTIKITVESAAEFLLEFSTKKATIVYGHAHSVFILAKLIKEHQLTRISPKGIVSTSMMLLDHERELIEDVFNCKVTNRYGCEEVGLIASQCEEYGSMHLNMEHNYTEIINDTGKTAKPGEAGKVVVTDLENLGMPLIRYRVEDVAIAGKNNCPCGRGLKTIEKVSGRVADFLLKNDGTLVAGVSLVERTLTAVAGLEQMQIIQNAILSFHLNIVHNEAFTDVSQEQLTQELKNNFSNDIKVSLNKVEKIPQESSGKYRFAINRITQ